MSYVALSVIVALISLGLERLFGYPGFLYGAVRHPVVWMGALISALEARLNLDTYSFAVRRIFGGLTLIILLLVTVALTVPLTLLLRAVPGGIILEAFLATSMLAQRSLHDHVQAVRTALSSSLDDGREAVRHIVGRDPAELDEGEIAKAAIESLAENTSDGIVAPLLYLALFGLPGAAFYKAINTADSMIGYKSDRYHAFGFVAAKLDDIVNLPASRLSAVLFSAAAATLKPRSGFTAMRAAFRDATRHASPNAGWPEAALAGALSLKLGGPRSYGGKTLDLPAMGDGRAALSADDIDRALTLYRRLLTLCLCGLAVLALVIVLV
ncbi:MAG: adenosylcobinamide-phosphate synthase CbiB [Pseudomonadota bacterium]